MSDARGRILARLRGRRPEAAKTDRRARQVRHPEWSPEERLVRFRERLEAVRAELHTTPRGNWVELLQALAREKGLRQLLYAPDGPLGADIEGSWRGGDGPGLVTREGPIETWKEALFFSIDGAVTSARAGIAETGTLVLWPDPAEPRTLSLVPPVHFAVLEQAALYATFAELVEGQQWKNGMPTNALLVSGPSKSADIEQTLAYGIHGPVELVVLLVTD
jgi:L-lactate dehydrogenase complex protein LldG